MNIAFPALLVILIGLPGIILRYTYRTGRLTTPFSAEPITEQLIWGIFLSVLLHAIWITLASVIPYVPPVRLESVLALLTTPRTIDPAEISQITGHAGWSLFYFVSMFAAAYALGHLAHRSVRHFNLDIDRAFLRFDNPWWYLLTGERDRFPPQDDDDDDLVVRLSAIVEQGDEAYVYTGIVYDFFFESGQLDRIELASVIRRRLKDDDPSLDELRDLDDPRLYSIPGNFLVLKYSSVKEINILYYREPHLVEEMPDPDPQVFLTLPYSPWPPGQYN